MSIKQIAQGAQNIFVIHANVTEKALFEGEWPIPNGVTLNSYIVCGKKTALIDLTADWEEAVKQFENELNETGNKIDYLILNHLEPDHTGYLKSFLAKYPTVEVIATAKGCILVKEFLKAREGETLRLRAVKDGEVLDLDGVKLEFYEVPNVHWPETMCTFERQTGTLFSCDAFGGYGKTGERIFDDEFSAEEHEAFYEESLRYYATIVSPFSASVKKAIDKLVSIGLVIKTVAPSHGIVWRKAADKIIARYSAFAAYNTAMQCEKEVCIICGSMYGNTRLGAQAVERGVSNADKDIKVDFIDVPSVNVSYALAAALRSKCVVIASPTCDYALYPPIADVLDLFKRKKIVGKKALRIGSFGWSGGAQREYDALSEQLKWENLPSYEWKGVPSTQDIKTLEEKGAELARLIQ